MKVTGEKDQPGSTLAVHPMTDDHNSNVTSLMEQVVMQEPVRPGPEGENDHLFEQFLLHHKTTRQLRKAAHDIDFLFDRFLTASEGRSGLRLQFQPSETPLFGENWLSIDLESIERQAAEGGVASLDLEDGYFDMVLCTGLDRISRPSSLIAEMRRVLKRRGQVWAQAPISQPLKSAKELPSYWQFNPPGFQVLFEQFDEIRCAVYQSSHSILRRDCFYYGLKPEISADPDLGEQASAPQKQFYQSTG